MVKVGRRYNKIGVQRDFGTPSEFFFAGVKNVLQTVLKLICKKMVLVCKRYDKVGVQRELGTPNHISLWGL